MELKNKLPRRFLRHHKSDLCDLQQNVDKLIGEQKLGEALNCLRQIIEKRRKDKKAQQYVEQLEKILEYQNKDVFASTNLDMDPWLEI
jgi:iron uptake system EfeUOB component EfeO/EfeM